MCNQYKQEGKAGCTQHKIEARGLYEAVLHDIQFHAQRAVRNDEAFLASLVEQMGAGEQEEQRQLQAKAKKGAKRLEELDGLYEQLYEDRAAGRISERKFALLSEKYEQEQNELEQLIREAESVRCQSSELERCAELFVETVRSYADIRELDAAILNTLIDRITVSEPEMVDGEKRQKITIYYRFIGNISE